MDLKMELQIEHLYKSYNDHSKFREIIIGFIQMFYLQFHL